MTDYVAETATWYEENAVAFVGKTVGLPMEAIRQPFVNRLLMRQVQYREGPMRVLDVGCGSGRDSRAFVDTGFVVTAIEPSENLARVAEGIIGQEVERRRVQDVTEQGVYDGIWACSSLLHIPHDEQPGVIFRLARALKPGGYLFVSYKYGHEERVADGRFFADMTYARLGLILEYARFRPLEMNLTDCRGLPLWLNALCEKPVESV